MSMIAYISVKLGENIVGEMFVDDFDVTTHTNTHTHTHTLLAFNGMVELRNVLFNNSYSFVGETEEKSE